jgi:hypothetical protein
MTNDARPHSVRIRVPVLGLSQRRELEEAARTIGDYSTTDEIADDGEWVRFDFAVREHARNFRSSAGEIAGDLVAQPYPPADGQVSAAA